METAEAREQRTTKAYLSDYMGQGYEGYDEESLDDQGSEAGSAEFYYGIDQKYLPDDFPTGNFMPYYEYPLRKYRDLRFYTKKHKVLINLSAYEMRKKILATEAIKKKLNVIFNIHRKAFNATLYQLWNLRKKHKEFAGLSSNNIDSRIQKSLKDPTSYLMLNNPWIAKKAYYGNIVDQASAEALELFHKYGLDILTYRNTSSAVIGVESMWVPLSQDHPLPFLKNMAIVSETGNVIRVDAKLDSLIDLFHLKKDSNGSFLGEKIGGFFFVRKGLEDFYISYRFFDEDERRVNPVPRLLLNSVCTCHVLPPPVTVNNEIVKVAVAIYPSAYDNVMAYIFSPRYEPDPSHPETGDLSNSITGGTESYHVNLPTFPSRKEFIRQLTQKYDHVLVFDSGEVFGGLFMGELSRTFYGKYLYPDGNKNGSKKFLPTLSYIKDGTASRTCSRCHHNVEHITPEYVSCKYCGKQNNADMNTAFVLWLKWCWGVTGLFVSGLVQSM